MRDQANSERAKSGGQGLGVTNLRAQAAVSAPWPAGLHWLPRPLLQVPDSTPSSSCFASSQGFSCKDASEPELHAECLP